MKFTIENKIKKELFVSIFQTLKNCTTILSLLFKKDGLFIQGMDKSHVCMFELFIKKSWFHYYETILDEKMISLDSQTFFTVLTLFNFLILKLELIYILSIALTLS